MQPPVLPIIAVAVLLATSSAKVSVAQPLRRLPRVDTEVPTLQEDSQPAWQRGEEAGSPTLHPGERSLDVERRGLGSSERLIDRLTDPTSWLMDFRLRELAEFPVSDASADSNTIDFRLQMPFLAWGEVNLMRVDVPYNISSSKGSGLGNVTMFDLLVFHAPWGRWGIGPGLQLSPGTSDEDTFQAGPVAATAYKDEHWTIGILSQNYFSGDNSLSVLQPILAYKFNESFAVEVGDMEFKYQWNQGAWTQLPLGCQVDYIVNFGGQKIEFFANPQYNFRGSSGVAEWQFYFGITLTVPEA